MIENVNRRKKEEYNPDYIQSDKEVVNHIGAIVAGGCCGPEGISICGVRAKEEEDKNLALEYLAQIRQEEII